DASDVASEDAGGPGNGPVCGPHQLIYSSPPLAEDVLVAGNFDVDLSLTSTQPGGNLVATLYHTPGDASCADVFARAQDAGRAQLDLRHWREQGASRDFPVGERTRVSADSLPLAARIPAGHRLVLAIGSGSAEIEPDPLKPRIAVETGRGLPGSLELPVVDGRLSFRAER
ncbi:MAG: CocE/NonD family hydrolase C-terminal non-catalytic domain-containing protein, partial [Solirubrobacteraceae bacterium]